MSFAKTIAVEQAPTKTFRDNKENYKWWHKVPDIAGYSPESISDGTTLLRNYKSDLHISLDQIYTPTNRCKGMFITVEGNLIVDGTISMSGRGANATGDNLSIDYSNVKLLVNDANYGDGTYDYEISSVGGTYGSRKTASGNNLYGGSGGSAGTTYACGGGGGGGARSLSTNYVARSGYGSAGTSYSGGSGGGGAYVGGNYSYKNVYAGNASGNGGRGGSGACNHSTTGAGGGAGNPGGSKCGTGSIGNSGTGGLLIILVKGNVIINETGIIESDGLLGGAGSMRGDGGSSGGGSVNLLYGGTLTNNGTIRANGGARRDGGGAGGTGTIRVEQVIF